MIEQVSQAIDRAMGALFPHGAGRAPDTQVRHHLEQVARAAFQAGRDHALLGLMTVQDVADHLQVTPRRARALIANRHRRFGVGMRFGNSWLVHRDELETLRPIEKYRP